MKRPGLAGTMLLGAFGIAFIIEFKTLLGMVGIEVAYQIYLPITVFVFVLAFGALYVLSDGGGPDASGVAQTK
jgi:hypothetical protein